MQSDFHRYSPTQGVGCTNIQLTEALGSEYRLSLETLGKFSRISFFNYVLQRIKKEARSIHSRVLRTISLVSSTDSKTRSFKFQTLQHLFKSLPD